MCINVCNKAVKKLILLYMYCTSIMLVNKALLQV
jgi:hypothetical protein